MADFSISKVKALRSGGGETGNFQLIREGPGPGAWETVLVKTCLSVNPNSTTLSRAIDFLSPGFL